MTADPDPGRAGPGPRSSRRRRGRRALLLALVLLPVALYATRELVLHPLLARAAGWVAPRLGFEVTVGAVRGDWWSTLALEDVRVRAAGEDGALRELDARRVAVEYGLRELLRDPLAGLRRVEVEGLRLAVDATRRGSAQEEEAPASWPAWPARLPAATVRDVEADVRLAAGTLEVRGLRADVAAPSQAAEDEEEDGAPRRGGAGGGQEIGVRAGALRWTTAGGAPLDLGLGLRATADAGRVVVHALDAGPVHVDEGSTVDLSRLAERRVAWDVDLRALGGALHAEGALDGGAVDVRFDGEGFDAERIAFWWPELEPEALAGTLALAGEASVAADGTPRFTARATARDAAWRGRTLDELTAEATLAGSRLRVTRLEASQGPNALRARDVEATLDAPDVAALLRGATGELAARVEDLPRLLERDLGDVPPHELELAAALGPEGLRIASGYVETAGGRLDVLRGRLEWDVARDAAQWPVELDVRTAFADLGSVGELLGGPAWGGELTGEVRLAGTLGEPEWTAQLEGSGVQVAGRALGAVRLSAAGDAARARIETLSIAGDDLQALGSGGVVLAPLEFEQLALDGTLRRPGGWTAGLEELLGAGAVVSFEARLDGPLRALDGTASVRGESLLAAGADLGPWSLEVAARGGALAVRSSRVVTPWGRVDLEASCADPFGGDLEARLDALRVVTDAAELALVEPTSFAWTAGRFALEPARLAGTAGELELAARQGEEGIALTARAADLRLRPFLAASLPEGFAFGALDLELEASGLGTAQPRASVAGTLAELSWADAPGRPGGPEGAPRAWDARVDATLEAGVLRVGALEIADGDEVGLSLAMDAPLALGGGPLLAEGPVRVEGTLDWQRLEDLWPPGLPWSPTGAAQARLDLHGAWSALEGSVELDADGSLQPPQGAALATSVRARVELGPDAIVLAPTTATVEGLGRLEASGRAGTGADAAAWIEGGLAGLREAALDARADVELDDLAWLAEQVPALRRTAGRAKASVTVAGTPSEPLLNGELEVREGELRTNTQLPPLAALEADVAFDGREVRVTRCRAEMGAAPVELSGSIDIGVRPPALALHLEGKNALLARTSQMRLRADLDLNVSETLAAPRVDGTVRLRNTRMLVDVDFVEIVQSNEPAGPGGLQLFSLREPPLSNTTFDVRVLTEEPVGLRGNLMRGELRTDLTLGGTGEVPLPVGSVFLDEFRVSLPSGTMRFDFGRVEFERGNPFDPTLALRGESKLFGYDVAMTVQGPLSSPELVMSSSPSLQSSELLLMVMTGQAPGAGTVGEAGTTLAVYFGRSLFSRGGSLDEDESILERLEVQTGREVSRGGTPTTEASLRLIEGLAGQDSQLLLTGEQDVYEDINMGLRLRFVLR